MKQRWEPVANTQIQYLAMSKCGLCGAVVLASDQDKHWSYHHLIMEGIIALLQNTIDQDSASRGTREMISWMIY